MPDKNERFATELLLQNGITFDKQGKVQLSPAASKILDAYRNQPGAQDNVNITRMLGKPGAGVAWSPTQISLTEGTDARGLAHELRHTQQPEITTLGKLKGVLTGQPVSAAALSEQSLNEPLSRLSRAVTNPSKEKLLDTYKHRVQKTFEAEVDAQAGMKDLVQQVIPSYNPEAGSSVADGKNYAGYPASYIEKAINAADKLSQRDDGQFNSKVADLRRDYNIYMRDKMGTTYSPNPYK